MVPEWLPLQRLVLVGAAVGATLVLAVVERPRRWGRRLRSRLLLGVPWGTLVVCLLLLAVYYLVQDGLADPSDPVEVPFRAWTYFYPLGMATASFAHANLGHLVGNLVGTLTLGTLAEYAWGHYPRERGAVSFGSPRANPYVRAFLAVPGVTVLAGLFTALFALGPVIGFSGVVFAFGGFALVAYPIGTVLALVAGRVVSLLYYSLRSPEIVRSARWTYETPWWANVAIQGHALGLLLGVLAGTALLRRRGRGAPSPGRLFAGALLFGVSQSLWAVYWFRGAQTFVLYRAVGLALVFALAVVVAVAVAGRDRPLSARLAASDPTGFRGAARSASPAAVGATLLVLSTAALAGPAVPVNLTTATDEPLPGETVTVEGYEVTYAEDVPDGMVAVVDVEAFGESTRVNTSGVVVRSEERHLWTTAVSRGRLAGAGEAEATLGGVGWREEVTATRTGWRVAGNDTVYRVTLAHDGERTPVFASENSTARPVVAGRNVTLEATRTTFFVRVDGPNGTARAPLPPDNSTVRLGGVRVVRENDTLLVEHGDTVVPVAAKETYRGDRSGRG